MYTLFIKYKHWLKNEALEQAKLALWLYKNNYRFTSIPNSTWTKSHKQKVVNTLTGLNPGLCDLLIILKNKSLLFIEMKNKGKLLKSGKTSHSNSKISDNQKEWIEALNKISNVEACVCYGYDEAVKTILFKEKL